MGNVYVEKLPKCDCCEELAVGDMPTKAGPWANLCKTHARIFGIDKWQKIGTIFKVRKRVAPKGGDVRIGIERSTAETIVTDGVRYIGCPSCGEDRLVEPDARYTYDCEGCGAKVKVPAGIYG